MEKHYTSCFKILALSLLLSLVHFTGFAQKKSTAKAVPAKPVAADTTMPRRYRVGIMAKAFGDSVVIRWAPNHAALFRQALRSGYMLTRRSFNENKKLQLDWQVTVRPWTAAEWQQQVSKNDTLAAACSQLVNGTNTPIGASEVVTLDKILDQQNQNDLRMMLSLILADVNPRNARGMALGWVDKKVVKGASYIYYIVPLTDQQLYPVDPAGTTVMNEKSNEQARMLPVKTSSGEHIVHLKWNRRMAENAFSSYFIERSDDGGKKFRRLTKRPWMQAPTSSLDDAIQYTDSVPQNYRPYKYRIFGITPFGELVPSEIITASSLDKTPPPTVAKLHAKHVQGTLVKVSWDYPDQPKDLGGFVVAKGMSMDGPFTPLTTRPLTSNAREFLDTTALPHLPNYYRVVAIDTARNAGIGLPVYCLIKDLKGPSKPTGLQGYIDTTGFVRIVWDQNPEPDIYGYRVIAANAPDHVFTGKTNGYLALPAFNDTTTLNA
ncbi:hypothetical protein, partial [Dyadobacter sp.]|uniref:hypothetical protein n=1 Tax=Dyadobacter sp. TaxID=1914288 RepID=UPI003F72417E